MGRDGLDGHGGAPGALRTAAAALDQVNAALAAGEVDGRACGDLLLALGGIQARAAAARAGMLRRFDAAGGPEADGYRSASSWLAAKGAMSKPGARAAVRQMHQLSLHPLLHEAMSHEAVTDSLASALAESTRKLPPRLREETDRILLDAAAAGASPEDLAVIAECAAEQWRRQQPDTDGPDPDDRSLRLGVTFGGVGVIRGDLTPECAAAVRAVLEALGKRRGQDDDRTEAQRFHDALELACQLLLQARLVPDRAGAATTAVVHIPLSQLRNLPGAVAAEEEWLRTHVDPDSGDPADPSEPLESASAPPAPPHEPPAAPAETAEPRAQAPAPANGPATGAEPWLEGDEATAAACDARVVPVVTGRLHLDAVDKIIALARAQVPASPQARLALRYAIARLAVDLVSGPRGLASALRGSLLGPPWDTRSLPLDIGLSRTIPAHIRRAVQLRDRHCAWPHCEQPAVQCDVHHLRHQADGGETSVTNCVLLCQFHHDHLIHRRGWHLILHPDGTTTARSPDGKTVRHSSGRPGPP